MTPYAEGYAAYTEGLRLKMNPYRFGSPAYDSWAEFQDNTNQGGDGA